MRLDIKIVLGGFCLIYVFLMIEIFESIILGSLIAFVSCWVGWKFGGIIAPNDIIVPKDDEEKKT